MEQQKVLWIIFSVALFVLVVVSISVVWFLPEEAGVAGRADGQNADVVIGEREYNPVQWVRGSEAVPESTDGGMSDTEDGIFIVYGESSEEIIGDGSEELPISETTAASTKETDSVETSKPEAVVAVAPTSSSSVQSKPKTATQRPKPAAQTPKPIPPKTVRVTEYWIQAGSYQSKQRAEAARDSLKLNGVSSRITTKDVGNDTFFRVRIGPYPNKAEASKFLDWVQDLSTFEGSYISQVYIQRTAN